MAVSGRKLPDFSGSLSRGSAEDVDHFCDPCLTIGQQVDAHKYCVDCEEYLCQTCSDYHLRTKALRNHQLVDKDKVGNHPTAQGSEVCTEKCPEHKQEVIKYFCPQHEALGCHVCMIMYHKTCEVDYIPDKCADIANSEEYRRLVDQLDLKLRELNEITQTTKVRDQEIDKCHHNLLQEIIKFRKEINDRLDQLQQKIQKKADKKKTEDKQIIQRILDGCNSLSSDIKKMQSTLQANKTSGKYGQLYITVKQAQSVLRSDEIKSEDGLERTAQQYIFERNDSLMNMLSKQDAFGKLSLTSVLTRPGRNMETLPKLTQNEDPKSVPKTPSKNTKTFQKLTTKEHPKSVPTPRMYMKTFHKLTKKEDINITTKSDQNVCDITGCAVLSSNKLVLADSNNNKLKLVNIQTKSVVEETSLDSYPYDVAVLSQDQIAVTMPGKGQVVIMTCNDRLSIVHTISVTGQCYGITHHHGQLYVVCVDPLCVLILDKQGNVQNNISLNTEIFSVPHYLVVSEDSKLLYISDWGKHCVVSITLQGEVTAVYKHKDLFGPYGMLMLDDGSLLVCCYWNDSIHHISGDLKQGQTVIDGLSSPQSICYNHHLHEVYIGREYCNQLTVYIPQ